MFLIVASTGVNTETELNKDAQTFLNQSLVLNAQIFINSRRHSFGLFD